VSLSEAPDIRHWAMHTASHRHIAMVIKMAGDFTTTVDKDYVMVRLK
jgi:hypothetical protein